MKKRSCAAALFLSAAMLLCSCGETKKTKTDKIIESIVNDTAAADSAAQTSPARSSAARASSDGIGPVPSDMDLTQMNATMIYSIIYDMMINPKNYEGKRMKVNGYFDSVVNEQTGTRYCFVVVPDATACCVQGLEFTLGSGKRYPDDYPEKNKDICVSGIIRCYDEAGQTYACIDADSLVEL